METVSFTQMASGTKEDYLLLGRLEKQHLGGVADRVIRHLLEMKDSFSGYQVDRLEHSLQCATRAYRDQASEELVVVALLLRRVVVNRPPPRSVSNLVLRTSHGRRPQRPGQVPRSSPLRRHRAFLRILGSAFFRPGL